MILRATKAFFAAFTWRWEVWLPFGQESGWICMELAGLKAHSYGFGLEIPDT
jgi:hypothetical protein